MIIFNETINDDHSDGIAQLDDLNIWQRGHRGCPPKEGSAELWLREWIMKEFLPVGNYTLRMEVVTKDRRRISAWLGAMPSMMVTKIGVPRKRGADRKALSRWRVRL